MSAPRGGIVDFAVAFPEGRMTVQQIHERSGVSVTSILEVTHCSEFPMLGEHEQAWELAARAASVQERLLDELDLLPERSVFNHSKYGHMGCSDTLIALQQRLAEAMSGPVEWLIQYEDFGRAQM